MIERRPRLTRRRAVVVGLGVLFVLLAYPVALASDALSNVAPASQLPGGSLTNAYPLGNYTLDHHFSAVDAGVLSGVDVSGIPPTIAWFLAELVWELTAFLANALITLFTFAFSLDLVNGSSATGGAGALAPVGVAVRSIYRDTFGEPWLVVAILLAGLWAMWNALVRRRYAETAGALGLSVLFVVIALAFVARPEIIGQASRLTNQMSAAFLALSNHGSLGSEQQAKQADADQLFSLLVYEPWAVLNFGGLEHCVTGSGDDQRSVPVRPLSRDPSRDAALAQRLATGTQVQADGKVCINNRNKYASHFLRFAPETDERNAEYDALHDGDTGKLPDADPAKADGSYQLGDADKPAADAMGKGGQYQRLLLAVVVFVGELGAFLLLGSVSVAVVLAQVLVLLLLAFAPVALVVGVFPGRGHEWFLGWLSRLGSFLLRKAVYSLVLAVLLTVSGALADATSNLGWLLAFGLQAVFYWTVLLQRKQLVGGLSHVATGHGRVESDGLGRAAVIAAVAARFAQRQAKAATGGSSGGGHDGGAAGGRRRGGGGPSDSGGDAAPEPPPRSDDGEGPAPSGPTPSGRDGSPRPPDPARPDGADAGPPHDDARQPSDAAGQPIDGGELRYGDARDADAPADAHSAPSLELPDSSSATSRTSATRTSSRPGTTTATAGARAAVADATRAEPARSAPELHDGGTSSSGRDVAQESPLRQSLTDDARRLHDGPERAPRSVSARTSTTPPTRTPPPSRLHEAPVEPASAPTLDGDPEGAS
ncbi:MAG TPA: type IV secretion system protein [Conexibacter sp.]|nr:type IV secretion system protein [Conexibacter sp.]